MISSWRCVKKMMALVMLPFNQPATHPFKNCFLLFTYCLAKKKQNIKPAPAHATGTKFIIMSSSSTASRPSQPSLSINQYKRYSNFEYLFGIPQYPADTPAGAASHLPGVGGGFIIDTPAYVKKSCALPCQTHINVIYIQLKAMMEHMHIMPKTFRPTELYWYMFNLPNSNVIYNICTHWKPANPDWYDVLLAISKEVLNDWIVSHPYKLIVKEYIKCKQQSDLTCKCRNHKTNKQ